MAESVLRVSFQIDFTSGYLLDYDLWALGDIDPQISLVGADDGMEVFRLNAHPNEFATSACPYNDQSDPGHCAGVFAGTLAAGTYALTARVEAASYYPYGGSADFTLSVAPLLVVPIPEPDAALLFSVGAVVIGAAISIKRRRPDATRPN
jgi:hypothetical protein